MNKIFHLISYHLVFPLFFILLYLWTHTELDIKFITFVFTLPVLYGYITPFIATTLLRKWKFHHGLTIGNIYYHHGFKIASHLILFLSIALIGSNMNEEFSTAHILSISFCVGSMEGFFIWIHDIFALKYGHITMSKDHYNTRIEPEVLSFKFAPPVFFGLGFSYAFSSLIFFNVCIQKNSDINLYLALLLSFFVINMILGAVYHFCEKNMR